MTLSRDDALSLLTEYTESESLLKHAFSVEAAMRGYAQQGGHDIELWGITGLLHDFDYERFPTPTEDGHPYVGAAILREKGYPDEMVTAILGHALYTGVPRETELAKTLFACDELCGLITAAVLVRPDRSIHQLTVKSVKKKLKDKAFARGVSRDDIKLGVEELGVELDEHIAFVIASMARAASTLGLAGTNENQ
ncbi:MAG: HDIG domain-containing protein [Bdellovibrionales bacterium]|nr:HDIG domain-containing protein [Bdellovibrionales bacterium]